MTEIHSENNKPFIFTSNSEVCIYHSIEDTTQLSKLILPKQQHGNDIIEIVTGDEDVSGDALITSGNFILGIATRDCAPVCFADKEKVGIAHVGWRGLVAGLPQKMLEHFDLSNTTVYIGPFLRSFEIQKDFCYEKIVSVFGAGCLEEKEGLIIFNFQEALASVLPANTIWDERDTKTDPSLPSHRRGDKHNFITTISRI